MNVAIVVDSILNRGGIQRIVLSQAKHYNADIFTGEYAEHISFSEFKNFKVKVFGLNFLPQRLKSLFLKMKFRFLNLSSYDLIIVHGGACLGISRNNSPTLWYCHAPTIWLYSTSKDDLGRVFLPIRFFVKLLFPFLKLIDKKNVSKITKIVTNSNNVKKRVKKIYGRNADIIFPFVNTKKFIYKSAGDFYFSPARLTPDKRVDVIVEAFKKMPDKKLVVASGGSEIEKIKKSIEGYNNIKVLGWVSEKKLQDLYGHCIATIAASLFEDFGMIAIESMAAGKPMIASGDKGYTETIINYKSGYLIKPTISNIIKFVKKLTSAKAKTMRFACETRAKLFSEEVFLKNMSKVISKLSK